MSIVILSTIIGALLLDLLLGEPRKFHPLVGFGKLASNLEENLNINHQLIQAKPILRPNVQVLYGSFAVILLISPFALLIIALERLMTLPMSIFFNTVVLYWAIGHQSLREHAHRVLEQCLAGNLTSSQKQLAMIVSRDTEKLNQEQVIQATVETVLENGSDAIFAPLFWFVLLELTMGLGAVAVVVYRLSNTLDAMWGYRNQRFNYFGRFAARLDDVLNYLPARLVSLSYAILGNTKLAINCWRLQSPLLKSPNAGPVMTAGAGSLDVRLGGPSYYHQTYTEKPYFGSKTVVKAVDIERSLRLIRNSIFLWCFTILILTIVMSK